jgi:hypothetical protein
MKNKLVKTILILILGIFSSCTSDDLTSLNRDTKNATVADARTFFSYAQKALADNMHGVAYRATGPGVTKMWVQHITAVTYLEGATYIPEFSWAPLYRDVLKNLDESASIISQTETSNDSEDTNKLAMIEILKVYTYAALVEAYGDIPYSEALDFNNATPQFDDAQVVYLDLIDRLTTAISILDTGSAGFGAADLIYNGDIENWVKFGNSLKLRMGLRIIDALPEAGAKAVSEAVPNVITTNGENAVFEYLVDYPNTNPWWSFLVRQRLEYYVGTNTFIEKLNKFNDPRRAVFFTPVEGEFVGAEYGVVQNYHSYSREGEWLRKPDLAAIFIDKAQVEFLLAEAAERGIGGVTDPEAHYNVAIRASFEYYGIEDQVDEYLAQPSVDYSTAEGPWQKKIGIQKWIALFDQGFEAWTEYRRLGYPQLSAPEVAESDIVPLRFLYPIGEQTLNEANYQEAAAAIGGDSYSTRLFWDVD